MGHRSPWRADRREPRPQRPNRIRRCAAVGVGLALSTAACSRGGGTTTATVPTTGAPDSIVSARRNVDGRLRLGVWLPASGSAEMLGTPLLAAVELAVREINEAGGVNGEVLEVVNRDEGSDPGTASQALSTMLEQDQVDIIVGPASSRVALGALDVLAAARAVTCSPTAAAIDLDQRRDNGFFVRTIGSEALEAVALSRAMIATGDTMFAVLYPDDDYGLAFADQVQRSFRRLREVVRLVPYDPTSEQFNGPVTQALEGGVEVIGVIGSGTIGAAVLASLAANDATPDRIPTFVTDGLRRDDLGGLIDPRQPTASTAIQGVSPLARPQDPTFEDAFALFSPGTPVAYAAYAYDCVNLLALAAEAAGSDDAVLIQAQLATVSAGGTPCTGFSKCATQLMRGRNINLDGASGDLDLQDDGDVGVASYEVFEFDEAGQATSVSTISVRVDGA
jgi:branched-chain amino acid transport system substrate-binding protein